MSRDKGVGRSRPKKDLSFARLCFDAISSTHNMDHRSRANMPGEAVKEISENYVMKSIFSFVVAESRCRVGERHRDDHFQMKLASLSSLSRHLHVVKLVKCTLVAARFSCLRRFFHVCG